MITMSKSQQIKLIKDMYSDLRDALEPFSRYQNPVERVYKLELEAERDHRGFKLDSVPAGISVSVAAKLFVVQHLLDAWLEPKATIDIIAVLDYRLAVLEAWALAWRYSGAISKALCQSRADVNPEERARQFLELDYVKLIQP